MKTRKDFEDFARLLLEIYVESEDFGDVKMPDCIINATADSIQEDYNTCWLKEDENGNLYHIYVVEEYCGLYELYFKSQTK